MNFEFVDSDQMWTTTDTSGALKPTQPPETADPFLPKLEPKAEWDDLDDIKMEELIIEDAAVDVGDHCYARSKINIEGDHCYAKATEQEVYDLYLQLLADSQADAVVEVDGSVDGERVSQIEFVDVNSPAGGNELPVVDVGVHEGDGRVEVELEDEGDSLSASAQKGNWQIDLKTLLEETYLKERGFPVSKDLPLRPPESVQPLQSSNEGGESDCSSGENNSDETDLLKRRDDKTYTCNKCNYRTTQKTVLRNHLRIHSGEKPFKCTQCDYRAAYKWNLDQHMRIHTGEKPYKCSVCDFGGSYKYALIKHLETHADVLPYKCSKCGFRALDEVSVAQHERSHSGQLRCRVCGFATSKPSVMQNHMIRHSREKGPKSDMCDLVGTFDADLALNYELEAKNPGSRYFQGQPRSRKSFRCASCEYTTYTKAALVGHMETHTGKNPYKCIKCSYSAMTSEEVNAHMKMHRTEVPYKCGECDYTTRSSIGLLNHTERHRPRLSLYKCTKCRQAFQSKSRLVTHLKQHEGRKLFKCSNRVCNYTCEYNWELHDHMRVHFRYECKMCGCKVLSRLQLAYHKRIHTKSAPK